MVVFPHIRSPLFLFLFAFLRHPLLPSCHPLIYEVAERLKLLPPIAVYESEIEEFETLPETVEDIVIRREGGKFVVEGDWIYNLMGRINFDNYESLNYFQQILLKNKVFERLEEAGCRDGNTVSIYDFEFDYVK